MLEIRRISEEYKGWDHTPFNEYSIALTSLVGIIFLSTWGGRSGEWLTLTRSYVKEQIAAGHKYLVCPINNTYLGVYGEVVKQVHVH